MSTTTTNNLSLRLQRMEESATLRMAALARELRNKGKDIIALSLGEPDFDTPQHIKDAAVQALADGHTGYPPVPGVQALREAICEKFERDNGLSFQPNQVVVSNGAKQSLANIFLSILNDGDEVIILAPYWVSYSEIVKLGDGKPVVLRSTIEEDYKVSADRIREVITDRTRAVLFSSPSNPTGMVYRHDELKAIAEVLAPHDDILIVSDEIYEYITFEGEHVSIAQFPEVRDRVAIVNGFSKGFAMTGWRLGYLAGPAWLAKACSKIQGQTTSGAAHFNQIAAAHALRSSLQPTFDMRDAFRQRRDLVIELLSGIPGIKTNHPGGAFYVFPDISAYFGKSDGQITIQDADGFCEYLLHQANVALVTGKAFGADNCVRLSFAASEAQLREAIDRIGKALGKLS